MDIRFVLKNKIANNASWMIVCKIGQIILSLVVTMISARYLGPSNYGVINYAAAIVAFIAPVAKLGLNNILVQEFVSRPKEDGDVLGTSLTISAISSCLCMIGITAFSFIANAGKTETILVCFLYSFLLLFQGAELIQYWFQYRYIAKYYSFISIFAYTVVSCYKIALLVLNEEIYLFALSNVLDYALILFISIYFYKRNGGNRLRFSFVTAKHLLSKSKYYIVSGMMIVIFTQTDKIMLNFMMDEKYVGIYSAAATISALANFVFTAIIDSFRPTIFDNHQNSHDKFVKKFRLLNAIIIYLALALSLVVTLLSPLLVYLIYGYSYLEAVNPLRILIWCCVFSFIGVTRNIWILAESKQKWLWLINLSGALANVVLNLLLIPVLGVNGAAIASLASQIFANIVVSFCVREIRPGLSLVLGGINVKKVIADNIRNGEK